MTAKSLLFKVAAAQDAEEIRTLIQSAFRAEDSRADWVGDMGLASSFHLSIDEVLPIINSPDSEFLIATSTDTGSIIGTVAVLNRDNIARLVLLAIDPTLHRGGIGRQVVRHAEEYCRQTWGAKKLGLNALCTRKALIAWYTRCGFQPTGETTPFPRDRFPERDLPEDLCFVDLVKDVSA